MNNIFTFTPSEFAFGYGGCKRCYYDLKIKNIRIQTGFPSIFSKLDVLQKEYYNNKSSKFLNTEKVDEGIIKTDYTKMQTSRTLKDKKNRLFRLRGKIDAYIKHSNYYSIIDFKVTNINKDKINTYQTQLNSYALMFEYPDEKSLKLSPINKLGIFCFEPSQILEKDKNTFFEMSTFFFEIERNDEEFLNFITKILDFLNSSPPEYNSNCSICFLKKNNFS